MSKISRLLLATTISLISSASYAASVTLYDQDFESPNNPPGYVNGSGSGYDDLSQQSVNDLYGGQPAGFSFAQAFTVETALLTGIQAFGTGYKDLSGIGGNYAIGMLSSAQNDLLGLSFNVGFFDFFNFTVDVSSLGLSGGPGAPFTDGQTPPEFHFTLFDNPLGTNTTGSGTILDQASLVGTSSAIDTLDWTNGLFTFDTSGATNGSVILQIDLLTGGYGVMDNFKITASDIPGGGLNPVPVPAAFWLFGTALIGFVGISRKRKVG